jgi:hypothetical protein
MRVLSTMMVASLASRRALAFSVSRTSSASATFRTAHLPTMRSLTGSRRTPSALPLRMASVETTEAGLRLITDDPSNNVSPYIANLVGRSLHRKPEHPLGIIKAKIEECAARCAPPDRRCARAYLHPCSSLATPRAFASGRARLGASAHARVRQVL